mgnify:CR=1 FL=1
MRNLALGALVAVAGLAVACDGSGRTYPSGRSDSDYNLRAMALTLEDLPRGFTQTEITQPPQSPAQFNNERWSLVINADEAEALRSQLEAQGRLSNYVAAFSPGGLGPVLAITSISTLYTDVESAKASVERFVCGLPLENSVALEGFSVPTVADGSAGFFVRQVDSQGQPTFVDTTVCFRTGRVIHAIQQTSVAGTEDIALGVRLAERMLIRVDAAFDEIDG